MVKNIGKFGELQQFAKFFPQFPLFHNIPYANGLKFAKVFSTKPSTVLIHQTFYRQSFYYMVLCSSCFLLCFYYTPIWTTLIDVKILLFECSITIKPEPIMLLVLPIIPSRISHNFNPLFLFYPHAFTYYSCIIL